jgi:hypothetical protein
LTNDKMASFRSTGDSSVTTITCSFNCSRSTRWCRLRGRTWVDRHDERDVL